MERINLIAAAVFAAAGIASADEFQPLNSGSKNEPVEWSELSNWTNRTAGAMASSLPGENDAIRNTAYYALDGDYKIGYFKNFFDQLHLFKSSSATEDVVSFGMTQQIGSGGYQHICVYDGVALTLEASSTYYGGTGDAQPGSISVYSGGTVDVRGTVISRHTNYGINEGGVLNWAPVSYTTATKDWGSHCDIFNVNGGVLNFTDGLTVKGGGGSPTRLNHNSGTVFFGGPFSSAGDWSYTWKKGLLAVDENVTIPSNVEVVTVDNAEVSTEVAEAKRLRLDNVTFGQGTVLTKTGAGLLSLDVVPESLMMMGGTVELCTKLNALACFSQVSVAEGYKAKIALADLYLLAPGQYTVVQSGNALAESDYEFVLDSSVSADIAVNADGSVVLTVYGVNEDPNALTWNPENDSAIWDAATAAWTLGGQQVAFADGSAVVFNGQESNYSGTVVVDGVPRASYLSVQSDRDYRFSGDKIDTMYVMKSGNGALMIDSGFTGRAVDISGGSLSFGSQKYVKDGIDIAVAASGSARLDAHSIAVKKLFDFRYLSGSSNWETRRDYDISLSVESIADFIEKASPTAPDGMSLSGKSVYIGGAFFVNSDEAGTWSFKGIYDDGIILNIDGEQLFKTTGHQDTKTANVVLAEGWHTFEIRAYDGIGGWGHANCVLAQNPTLESYVPFHEGNFDMNWYGSEIDSNLPPADIPVNLAIADGASVVFGSAGYNITDISIGENVSISIDPHTVPANNTFLVVKDAEVKAALKDMIQEALGDIGTVVDTEDGLAWKMEAVFNNPDVTDLEDANGWAIGIVPGLYDDVTITGDGVAPVMTSETRMFNSITVSGGASLAVAANREIPALTLNSGTSLHVSKQGLLVHEVSYPEFITKTETAIGMMDADKSIKEITDISGLIGGQNWNASLKGLPYDRVDVEYVTEENSEKLRVQFKHFENPYMKCVIIELRKDDQGVIYAKATDCGYLQNLTDYDYDFYANYNGYVHQEVATSDNTTAYGVRGVTFTAPFSVAANVTVVAAGAFAAVGDGTAVVDVDEGCVLDLSGVSVSCEATLVKRGAGAIVFGAENLPQTLSVEEGILVLQPGVQYDMTGIELGESVEVLVWQDDAFRVAYPIAGEDGTVIYYARGTYLGVGGWNDLDNWVGGTLPLAGDIVYLPLAGSELTVDDAEAAAVSKIILTDGTSAKILVDWAIPQLELAPSAGFFIGDNAEKPKITVTMDSVPSAQFALVGDTVQLPTFSIATNVTLKFSIEAKLKNLDMTVCGEVTTTKNNVGGVIFGHALKDETSYFALYADGATIHPSAWERTACTGHFVWPDEGGRVVQLRPYHFVKCLFPCNHWADYTNPRIGVNNPIDEPCEVVFDNTTFYYNQWLYVGGAAKVRCINGASIQHGWGTGHIGTGDAPARVMDWASIELDGEKASLSAYGQSARFAFRPDADAALEVPTVTLKDGASIKGFRLEGNGEAGLYVVGAGEWTIPKLYKFGDTAYSFPVLAGFAAAVVAEDSVFNIVGRNEGHSNTGSWHDWDRALPISGAIVGYGDVVVSNTAPTNSMCITVTSALNDCAGNISCNWESNCSILFADGANWTGTVVAGGVALTNTVDNSAASVDFGKLNLAADFPVRVWRNEDGTLVNDQLNVGEYANNGGRLVPQMIDGEFAARDRIMVGRIANTSELPSVARGWTVKLTPIANDNDNSILTLRKGSGMQIIVF